MMILKLVYREWHVVNRSFRTVMIRAQTPPFAPTLSRPAQLAEWFARDFRAGRLVSGEKLPTSRN